MVDILRFIHDTCCMSTIITNLLIIYIITSKTPDKLRSYSIILFNMAIIESVAAVCSLLLVIRILISEEYLISGITGPGRFTESTRLCFILCAIMMHGHAHYSVLLAFSFCYRYYVVNHTPPRTSRLISALGIVYLPTAFVFTCFASSPLLEDDEVKEVMAAHAPDYDNESQAATDLLIVAHRRGAISLGIAWVQFIVLPVYLIIVICSFLVNRTLSSSLKMSDRSKRMHREIMKALIFQSLLPVLIIIAAFYHVAREQGLIPEGKAAGHLMLTVVALILALSPLSTLCFIRPYRQAVKSLFSAHPLLLGSQLQTSDDEERSKITIRELGKVRGMA